MSEEKKQTQQTKPLFITPELTHRIELILHLLEHSNQIIVVKGNAGSGKTILLNELIKQKTPSIDIKAISITNSFSFEQFELSLWAAEVMNQQKVPALLIDDIDRIELNELNNLRTLIADKEGIRFCLFCLPTFIETLKQFIKESSNSEELHIVDVPQLTEDQTLLYIRNRYADDPFKSSQFNEELAQKVYQFNHGLPGKIDTYCEQYLTDPALNNEGNKRASINLPNLFINKVSVSVIVIVAILSFVLFIAVSNKPEQESNTVKIKLEVPKREVVEVEKIEPLNQNTIEVVETPVENLSVGIKQTKVSAKPTPDVNIDKSISVPEPSSIPKNIVSPHILWLNEQDTQKYVLQLLGAQERKTIELYKNSFADPDEQLRVITTLKEGEEWHILIYGLYETREKAKKSIQGLPARAKQLSPWPRTISSIKDQLN